MSQDRNDFDIFDPTGMLKTMRNDNIGAWAKAMAEFVNTDAYAEATGAILDASLANSAPFREAMEKAMKQTLANLKMPSRDDVIGLAQRLTNLEFRLDDMDAKLDLVLAALAKPNPRKRAKSTNSEN